MDEYLESCEEDMQGAVEALQVALDKVRTGRATPKLLEPVQVPEGLSFFGVDSGIRHAVSESNYACVRTGAFMGCRILESLAGAQATGWKGYLANCSPETFARFADRVPEKMRGQDFMDSYGESRDTVTLLDPSLIYSVRMPTAHPVYEQARIQSFADRSDWS